MLERMNWIAQLTNSWVWVMAWRDSRRERGRLALFAVSMVIGISAMTAIHTLKEDAEAAIANQEKALLGSDLQISSRQPFEVDSVQQIAVVADAIASETGLASMLQFPRTGDARLVQVRAFEGRFPFYGAVETDPANRWQAITQEGAMGVLVEQALLDQFGAEIGETVRLGELEVEVIGIIRKPLPRSGRFSGFAPEVYVPMEALRSSGLLGATVLATHHLHILGDGEAVKAFLDSQFADESWRTETPESRRETLGDAVENFRQFLSLLAMSALVLGAIGVASAIHAHLKRRVQSVAILRCLGASGNLASAIYLVQSAVLGLVAAFAGTVVGVGLRQVVLWQLRTRTDWEIGAGIPWDVVLQASLAGLGVCVAFALLPLLRVRKILPITALRQSTQAEVKSTGRLATFGVLLILTASVFGLAWFNTSDALRALIMTGGLIVVFAFLWAVSRLLVWATRHFTSASWPYPLRQGLSNLHRPNNQTLLFLLSIGLGTFLLLTILFGRNLIVERTSTANTEDGPSIYLVDVQAGQVDGVVDLLEELDLPTLESASMITMRLESVKGRSTTELMEEGAVPRWVLQREFRSTYRETLNATEKIVSGNWPPVWSGGSGPVPVSLEADLAADLSVSIGDAFSMNVQGRVIECVVGSIREIDWSRFNLNFFMLFPNGVLEGAPGFHVVTSRLDEGDSSGALQSRIAEVFPGISVIDLALLLETVRTIIGRILMVVGVLSGFSLAAGLLVLIGTLWNGRDARQQEAGLLRVLGASRAQIQSILTVEYAALGILAGLAGALPAIAANLAMAVFIFKASPWPSLPLVGAAIVLCAVASILAGLAIGQGASNAPADAIRSS